MTQAENSRDTPQGTISTAEARLRLNAAAPELLEALEVSANLLQIFIESQPPYEEAEGDLTILAKARAAIAKAEALLAAPQPADADGWIPWSGGECPLDRLTQVDVRYRNGDELMGAGPTWLAGSYNWNHNWNHDESDYDIIAYRVVKP